jgi:hypothetical protein
MAQSLGGRDTLKSGGELLDRQVDEAHGGELSGIVDSMGIPNARGNTKPLVGKPGLWKSS